MCLKHDYIHRCVLHNAFYYTSKNLCSEKSKEKVIPQIYPFSPFKHKQKNHTKSGIRFTFLWPFEVRLIFCFRQISFPYYWEVRSHPRLRPLPFLRKTWWTRVKCESLWWSLLLPLIMHKEKNTKLHRKPNAFPQKILVKGPEFLHFP